MHSKTLGWFSQPVSNSLESKYFLQLKWKAKPALFVNSSGPGIKFSLIRVVVFTQNSLAS